MNYADDQECPLQDLMKQRTEQKTALLRIRNPDYANVRIQECCIQCTINFPNGGDLNCEYYWNRLSQQKIAILVKRKKEKIEPTIEDCLPE